MKKKNIMLSICMILTVCIGSYCMQHITNVAAFREKRALDGVRLVLDPGHGGKDDGTKSNDVKEQDINLSIARKLKVLLEKSGAHVTMTRDGSYDLASEGATNRKKEDMKKRVDIINEENVDLFLSIHLNAYPNTSVRGAQAFYATKNEVAKVFAGIVQKHLKILTNTKMTSKPGDFYILNNTQKVGTLVECGFLSNPKDKENLIQSEYQNKIAKSLYDSIREYFSFLA